MSALPAEIAVTESPGGVRYRLPRRPLGRMGALALVPIVLGLVLAAVPLFFVLFFTAASRGHTGRTDVFAIVMPLVCFGPVFFPLGGILTFTGLLLVAGHAEVAVRGGRLLMTERVGPLGWTRRLSLDQVQGFRVMHGNPTIPETEGGAGQPGYLGNLMADLAPGKSVTVLWWYPREWLLALADDLALRCQRAAEPVPVADVSTDPLLIQERPVKPTDSDAVLDQRADALTITVPPARTRGGQCGLVAWCVVWNVMVLVFTALFLPAAFLGQVKWQGGPGTVSPLGMSLFLAPFWAVGVGSLLLVLSRARRRAVVRVVDQTLEVADIGLFGTHRWCWAAADLLDVRVTSDPQPEGEGGTRWEFALAVETRADELYRFLTYREKAELEWIATVLRRALRLGPPGAPPVPAASEGIQVPPAGADGHLRKPGSDVQAS